MNRSQTVFLGTVILALLPRASYCIAEEDGAGEDRNRTDAIVDRIFDRLDANKDGSISKDEFKRSWEQRRGGRQGRDAIRGGNARPGGPRFERPDDRRGENRRGGPGISGGGFRGPGRPPFYGRGEREWRGRPWSRWDRMARGPAPRFRGGPPRGWGNWQPRGPDFRRGDGPPWYRAGGRARDPRFRGNDRGPRGRRPEPPRARGPRWERQGGPGGRGEWTPPGPYGPRGRRGDRAWQGTGASPERYDPPGADGGLISDEGNAPTSTDEASEPSQVTSDGQEPAADVVHAEPESQNEEPAPAEAN